MSFAWPDGKRAAVSVTFDDARLTQADVGLPILNRFGVKGTFYVSFQVLEQRLAQYREAVANGHEIGNHSLTHPCSGNFDFARNNALEDYTLERMERELLDANAKIRELLGVEAVSFAYPCGQTFVGRGEAMQSYVPLVAKHFLVGRRAFDEVPNDPGYIDLAMITGLDLDDAPWDRVRQMIDETIEQQRWLVLLGHEVGEGGRQTVRTDTLEQICEYCTDAANGVWIDNVAVIGRYIKESRTTC